MNAVGDLFKMESKQFDIIKFVVGALSEFLEVEDGEDAAEKLGYMMVKAGLKLIGNVPGAVGSVARVGVGFLEAGEKFEETGTLADSATTFVSSIVGLRRAAGTGSGTVAVQIEFVVESGKSSQILNKLRLETLLGPAFDFDNNQYGFFNDTAAMIQFCKPVAGGEKGAYACTTEDIGATVITYVTLQLRGTVPLDWPAYRNYTTAFFEMARVAVASVAGSDFDKDKVKKEWAVHIGHTIQSSTPLGIKVFDQLAFKIEIGNRVLKNKLQADTTTSVLNKMLSWGNRANVEVSSLTFSDSKPGMPEDDGVFTRSQIEAETWDIASRVCVCVCVCAGVQLMSSLSCESRVLVLNSRSVMRITCACAQLRECHANHVSNES
jgi:hypothetical protein